MMAAPHDCSVLSPDICGQTIVGILVSDRDDAAKSLIY